jgi:NitT/TauT family transport system substrate-binding protein
MERMRMVLCVMAMLAGMPGLARACSGPFRPVNIGVAVSPPNVIHTVPYVAKALGFFTARCIDPHIIQFDGGDSPAAIAAVTRGSAISALSEVPIAHGLPVQEIWAMAPVVPSAYIVAPDIKTASDLKGKRLSAAGGGVGGFNWLIGRAVLATAGLQVGDATFIAGGTAGRLPGLVAGQVDGVVLHPEDAFLAMKQRPGVHALVSIQTLLPDLTFNSYGASTEMIATQHDALRDTIAAMMDAARAIYTRHDEVIPVMVEATGKSREAVEYAWQDETNRCMWAVNTGFDPKRVEWTNQYDMTNGDVAKKLSFDQIVAVGLVNDALAAAGGPVDIHGCKS